MKVRNLRLSGSHRDLETLPSNGVELRQALRKAGTAPQKQRW